MANLIEYDGESKVIKRLCNIVNTLIRDVEVNGESVINEERVAEIEMLVLGEGAENAYPGNLGKEAHDHSLVTSGNPHHVTAEELGLGSVIDQINAIMQSLGISWGWITHRNEQMIDHDGNRLVFHGVGLEETYNIKWSDGGNNG